MLDLLALQQGAPMTGLSGIGHLDPGWHWRAIISFLLATLVLWALQRTILRGNRREQIPYVIAFNIAAFLVLGIALVITASREWATACLCAGACLLGGGFVGLLFGVPYGRTASDLMSDSRLARNNSNGQTAKPGDGIEAKQQSANDGAAQQAAASADAQTDLSRNPLTGGPAVNNGGVDATNQRNLQTAATVASARGRTLLEDTSSSLSKLLTGASLVKIGSIYRFFQKTSWKVGSYLTDGNLQAASSTNPQLASANIAVLGGALILYFLLLGFLSGLFLPAYFMKGWDD